MTPTDDRPLVVFDFDGTLLRGDSLLPYLWQYACRQRRWGALALLGWDLLLLACRLLPARSIKERVLKRFLAGEPAEVIARHTERFCRQWLPRHLHPVGLAQLRLHQARGHRVVLLSASPDLYVEPAARLLGIDEVICTPVCIEAGRCTGEIAGDNCKGQAKLVRLRRYLGVETAPPHSYAYGDSRSDLPVLRWVRHGFWMQRRSIIPIGHS
jgi:HAD superfamily hydrolase (TIGR01490 family)